MSKGLKAFETIVEMFNQYAKKPDSIGEFFKYTLACAMVEKELKALEIIKECLVSEFKMFEKNGEYYISFYFDEIHELTFKLINKEEFDLLKEVLE